MPTALTRGHFLSAGAAACITLPASRELLANPFLANPTALPERKFYAILSLGRLGFQASFLESVELATKYGFEGLDPDPSYFASLSDEGLRRLLDGLQKDDLQKRNLKFGAAGLPVEFRKDSATFDADLKKLPAAAALLERVGIGRVSTWIMPCSDDLTRNSSHGQSGACRMRLRRRSKDSIRSRNLRRQRN